MAFVSVKFQRLTAYISLILCLVLVYQLYHRENDLLRPRRSHHIVKKHSQRPGVREEVSGNGLRRGKSDDLREHISALKITEGVLRREVKALKSKLLESETHRKKLKEYIAVIEEKEKSLAKEISTLKNQNSILLPQVERYGNNSLKDQRFDNAKIAGKIANVYENDQNGMRKSNTAIPEDIPFQSFAKTHVFEAKTDPKPKEYIFRGQRKETRIIKPAKRHIIEIQDMALAEINLNKSLQITTEHLFDGVYRFDVNNGVDYELYFRHPHLQNSIIPVRLTRGLSKPYIQILPNIKKQTNEMVNLILPLSGRLGRFQNFIDLFIEVCIKRDKNVYLTVVLYGEKDFKTVKKILQNLENDYDFRKYQLIMRDKEFSRGRALHDGVVYWKGENPNVLMFFCDVDITFRPEFLRRCRAFTEPGKQVYYPVVFSLYNPKNVYEDGNIPEPEDQLKIDRSYGFWRTYGFGMTCQYRADYLKVGGFDLSIEGWGSEDQLLHSRYIAHRGIRVIRAPDRDLFHYYHEKHCDPNLKWQQYKSCLGSKAKTEGTPAQIAMQFMKLREKYEGFDEKNDSGNSSEFMTQGASENLPEVDKGGF